VLDHPQSGHPRRSTIFSEAANEAHAPPSRCWPARCCRLVVGEAAGVARSRCARPAFDLDHVGSSLGRSAPSRRTTATRRPTGAGGGEDLKSLHLQPISRYPLPTTDALVADNVERKVGNHLPRLRALRSFLDVRGHRGRCCCCKSNLRNSNLDAVRIRLAPETGFALRCDESKPALPRLSRIPPLPHIQRDEFSVVSG
jgi:hypothetical protein